MAKYSCIRCVVASSISHNIRILHTSCFRTQISKPRLFVLQLQSHKSPTVYGLTHSMSHVLQPDTPIKKLLLVRSDIDSVPLVGLPPDQVEEPAAQSPAHEEKHIHLSQSTKPIYRRLPKKARETPMENAFPRPRGGKSKKCSARF